MKTINVMLSMSTDSDVKKGEINLTDDYYKTLNDHIDLYYKQYGNLPKIELTYNFFTDFFGSLNHGIQCVALQFEPIHSKMNGDGE